MIGQQETINIYSLTIEQPVNKKAFPLTSGLELTDGAWNELLQIKPDSDSIASYYYHYSSLKILDYDRSKTCNPLVPKSEEILYLLENAKDPLSQLGDISILFPDIAKGLLSQNDWRYFGYQFDKAVRNNYIDESLENAFNMKLIDPGHIENGFLKLDDEYLEKALNFIDSLKKSTLDEIALFAYLRNVGFLNCLFPEKVNPSIDDDHWELISKEVEKYNESNFLCWYLRNIKLGMADKVAMTSEGLKVDVSKKHVWPKHFEKENFVLPHIRRF